MKRGGLRCEHCDRAMKLSSRARDPLEAQTAGRAPLQGPRLPRTLLPCSWERYARRHALVPSMNIAWEVHRASRRAYAGGCRKACGVWFGLSCEASHERSRQAGALCQSQRATGASGGLRLARPWRLWAFIWGLGGMQGICGGVQGQSIGRGAVEVVVKQNSIE